MAKQRKRKKMAKVVVRSVAADVVNVVKDFVNALILVVKAFVSVTTV